MAPRARKARKARASDVDEIAAALPETELGISWGDRPTWKVRGKGFLLYRMPHKTAIDPETGEMWDDLLVVMTGDEGVTLALLEADGPFFTIDHFRGFNGVLVRLSRLGEIDRDELAEIITEAWAAKAPKKLVREHLGD
ncbi:MmcQ/YjbR family DNA-binding protein [Knoellia sp. S7-12]|uniref:MmcQ/YjbR family DNA-binding protein n=1 Tax=Knoellia sp. S7-12 TaxID=3126698 RepID=UPI003366744B